MAENLRTESSEGAGPPGLKFRDMGRKGDTLTQRDRPKEAQGPGSTGKPVPGWHRIPETPWSLCPGASTQERTVRKRWNGNPGFPPTGGTREAWHPLADREDRVMEVKVIRGKWNKMPFSTVVPRA